MNPYSTMDVGRFTVVDKFLFTTFLSHSDQATLYESLIKWPIQFSNLIGQPRQPCMNPYQMAY